MRRGMARPALVSLDALSIMTGLLRVVADDDVALLWWGHIRTMVSLVIFVMSGGIGAVAMGDEVGLFLRGRRIWGWHPSCCAHPSVFVLMNPSRTCHQEDSCPLAAYSG